MNMHLMKKPGASDFEYRHFFVDVKGHGRIYLEGADAVSNKQPYQKVLKLFGVRWT